MDNSLGVLIVDDEPTILKTIQTMLKTEGFRTDVAESAAAAVEMMRQNCYQVVISDIKMPEMDGVELLKELKSVNPLCHVIMMTGYSTIEYVVECLGSGAYDYYMKPFDDIYVLCDAVRECARRIERWQKLMRDSFSPRDKNNGKNRGH